MPMNKAEKAEMEALRMDRDMYRAMVISPPVEPDSPPPKISTYRDDDFIIGWLPFSHSGGIGANKAATSSTYHRVGDCAWAKSNKSWSQGTRALYSLKVNALRQARHLASIEFAKRLARLDAEIAACESEPA